MNKKLKIVFLFFLLLIIAICLMMFFSICPPRGPWPMPPWCKIDKSFSFKKPEYINFPNKLSTNFTLGIGTMDIWGNPHLFLNLGEDTTKNYKTAIERANTIGSKTLFITDFINISGNREVISFDRKTYPGNYNIEKDYLKKIVSLAKEQNQERIILLTNLSDTEDEISGFISSADQANDSKEKIAGRLYKNIVSKKIEMTSKEIFKTYSEDDWKIFQKNLKQEIIKQAIKAQEAGVTDFIINPADAIIDYYYNGDLSKYWGDVAISVRKVFNGKIGFFGYPDILSKIDLKPYDFTVVYFEVRGDKNTGSMFKNVADNQEELKKIFKKYFSLPFWDNINNEKLLLVTISSYDGVKTGGWIEPGNLNSTLVRDDKEQAILYEALFEANQEIKAVDSVISYGYWWSPSMYPESKPFRNDLSHSIRGKDAENVFYNWAN